MEISAPFDPYYWVTPSGARIERSKLMVTLTNFPSHSFYLQPAQCGESLENIKYKLSFITTRNSTSTRQNKNTRKNILFLISPKVSS